MTVTVLGATRDPKWSHDAPRPEFHRFWIDFRRMLVRFSRIVDPIWTHRDHNTQSTTHNTPPTTHNTTNHCSCFSRPLDWPTSPNIPSIPRPGGMRARALNPPPPLGGRSVLNRNSRTCKLQSLSRLRTLCWASPKIGIGRPLGLNFPIFRFGIHFFCPKNILNFGSSQNAPKSQTSDLGACFGSDFYCFLDPFWHPFFSIFHNSPKTSIMQQIWSETLGLTSQILPFLEQMSI